MDSTPTLDPPTNELTAPLAAPSTERCASCGARMAPDQRYCLECGERRTGGGLRDALPRTQAAAPVAVSRRRAWISPNSSLIAGIATLLIAMGVGVLIGRTGDDNGGARASTPQIVTVSGAAAGAGASTAAATAADTSSGSKSSSPKKKKGSDSKAKVSGASSVEETARKNGVKLPPKVVKIGQKCEQGAKGCEGGKFTGNFFGGG